MDGEWMTESAFGQQSTLEEVHQGRSAPLTLDDSYMSRPLPSTPEDIQKELDRFSQLPSAAEPDLTPMEEMGLQTWNMRLMSQHVQPFSFDETLKLDSSSSRYNDVSSDSFNFNDFESGFNIPAGASESSITNLQQLHSGDDWPASRNDYFDQAIFPGFPTIDRFMANTNILHHTAENEHDSTQPSGSTQPTTSSTPDTVDLARPALSSTPTGSAAAMRVFRKVVDSGWTLGSPATTLQEAIQEAVVPLQTSGDFPGTDWSDRKSGLVLSTNEEDSKQFLHAAGLKYNRDNHRIKPLVSYGLLVYYYRPPFEEDYVELYTRHKKAPTHCFGLELWPPSEDIDTSDNVQQLEGGSEEDGFANAYTDTTATGPFATSSVPSGKRRSRVKRANTSSTTPRKLQHIGMPPQ